MKKHIIINLIIFEIMVTKIILRIGGIGFFIMGASSYFFAAPWPIDCNTIVCHIGTAIPLNFAMMLVGGFLVFLSIILYKRKNRR